LSLKQFYKMLLKLQMKLQRILNLTSREHSVNLTSLISIEQLLIKKMNSKHYFSVFACSIRLFLEELNSELKDGPENMILMMEI
jgi:hypothetical protein